MSNYRVTFVPGTPNHCWNKSLDLVKEGSTVLDVGCSWGGFGKALQEHKKCIVDGVEPDAKDAEEASQSLRTVFNGFVEDAFKQDLKGRSYDHIIFIDVIEHLYDPVSVLKLIKKHLNPGGTVIFSIPNMAHLSVRLMLLSGDFEYGKTGLLDKTHLHFYTQKEIERVFSEAGMSVQTWDYTEATYPPSLIIKELKKLGLTANKEAMELLTDQSARVFQFVGAAIADQKGKKIERVDYSPDPQGEIVTEYEERLKLAQQEVATKSEELAAKATALQDAEVKLNNEEYLAHRLRMSRYLKHYIQKKYREIKKKF